MKWNRLKIACCCSLMLSPSVFGQTLEQAVALTLKNNPDIKSAFNEFNSRKYINEAASGAYLLQSILMLELAMKAWTHLMKAVEGILIIQGKRHR